MNILAIGAHPDDIEFGCGGSLVRFFRTESNISMFIFTTGDLGGSEDKRKKEQAEAADRIKAKVYWGNYKDTCIPTSKEAISALEDVLKETSPDLIFVNWPDDTHQDHRAVSKITTSATRYIKNVLFYEVPTSQGFKPNVFVDIGDVIQKKIELLESHTSQVFATRIAGLNILESATSCANFRGFQGRTKYAEGFSSLRLSLFYNNEK